MRLRHVAGSHANGALPFGGRAPSPLLGLRREELRFSMVLVVQDQVRVPKVVGGLPTKN